MSTTAEALNRYTIPIPPRLRRLRTHNGFVVPWFVYWKDDGEPDFRVIAPGKMADAVHKNLCWMCGTTLGVHRVFIIGPMCTINRISPDPAMHWSCAEYAMQVCPFLSKPKMRRHEGGLPEGHTFSPTGISRNPGVIALWVTSDFKVIKGMADEPLFRLGTPTRIGWFTEGRAASRREVLESFRTGLPTLQAAAEQDGGDALKELARLHDTALTLVPPE